MFGRLFAKPGRSILDISIKKGDLEEVFLHLTGKTLHEIEKNREDAKTEVPKVEEGLVS